MLLRFRVNNFLTFHDTQEFSLIAGKPRLKMHHVSQDRGINTLKFSAVYGANAAGKSNLVKALLSARDWILSGPSYTLKNRYCKIHDENKRKPSTFEFDIKIHDRYYSYGFSAILSTLQVTGEWLYQFGVHEDDTVLLYSREFDAETKMYTFTSNRQVFQNNAGEALCIHADGICTDSSGLFLSLLDQKKAGLCQKYPELKILFDVNSWFSSTLRIITPQSGNRVENNSGKVSVNMIGLEELSDIFKVLGLGINTVSSVEMTADEVKELGISIEHIYRDVPSCSDSSAEVSCLLYVGGSVVHVVKKSGSDIPVFRKLEFGHGRSNRYIGFEEESDGTKRMMELLEILLAARYHRKNVFVVDEIDRSLHPDLTRNLIEKFLDSAGDDVQLIVTTHESRIMDLTLLRQDEIWFIEKNADGVSSLYSLEQYDERYDRKLDKAYFEGRYGAIPQFNAYFPVECSKKSSSEETHDSPSPF